MSTYQHDRTRARREVLQVMYSNELTGTPLVQLVDGCGQTSALVIPERPEGVEDNDLIGEELAEYAARLLKGIVEHLQQIDSWVADIAQNWTIERMPVVDRNIIRIAAYEIAFCDDIPTGVAINEAVEIAKAFGGDESPKFVNGVLGRVAKLIDGADPADIKLGAEALPADKLVGASGVEPVDGQTAQEGGDDGQ